MDVVFSVKDRLVAFAHVMEQTCPLDCVLLLFGHCLESAVINCEPEHEIRMILDRTSIPLLNCFPLRDQRHQFILKERLELVFQG